MSLTVDDLVSSLSSSHIGQEAIELAALQEYLRQTGFGRPNASLCSSPTSFSQSTASTSRQPLERRTSYAQLCNTPILSQTPISSSSMAQFGWMGDGTGVAPGDDDASHSSLTSFGGGVDEYDYEEAMVEDLLIPSSPPASATLSSTSSPSLMAQNRLRSSSSALRLALAMPADPPQSYIQASTSEHAAASNGFAPSLFASSDPFYVAQVQAQLQAASQNGLQHSSFYSQQQQQQQQYNGSGSSFFGHGGAQSPISSGPAYHQHSHQHRPSLAVDTHCMMVETPAFAAS